MYMHGMREYAEDDYLQLSGLQHFLFCRRQWALIHIENQWVDNGRTVDGNIMHKRTHDEFLTEKRGNTIVTRGMRVFSRSLGVSGQCDVLEFCRSEQGINIYDWDGLWNPFPVEYKKGEPKQGNYDEAQLCGQAMCLEEMLCCDIPEGALFYGEIKHRYSVKFDEQLRNQVKDALLEMHEYAQRGKTPKVKRIRACNACSLKEICLPVLMKNMSAKEYMEKELCEN